MVCTVFALDASIAIATPCTHASIRSLSVSYLTVEPPTVTSTTGDDYGNPTIAGDDDHDSHEDHGVLESELYRVFSV